VKVVRDFSLATLGVVLFAQVAGYVAACGVTPPAREPTLEERCATEARVEHYVGGGSSDQVSAVYFACLKDGGG
jgi:hypothetical protein